MLKAKYDGDEYVKGPDQSVPDWDNAQAGTIFEQMLTRTPNIKGVLAANDGLGNAAIIMLKKKSSTARSRSPARTRPSRACRTSSPVTSA